MPKLLTVGEMARLLKSPAYRIEHIIRTRGLREAGRAGAYRVFTPSDCEFIKSVLARIDRDKKGGRL